MGINNDEKNPKKSRGDVTDSREVKESMFVPVVIENPNPNLRTSMSSCHCQKHANCLKIKSTRPIYNYELFSGVVKHRILW